MILSSAIDLILKSWISKCQASDLGVGSTLMSRRLIITPDLERKHYYRTFHSLLAKKKPKSIDQGLSKSSGLVRLP